MFSHRVGVTTEWRKLRYWSRQFSSCKALPREMRWELMLMVGARISHFKTASPPVCREQRSSWDLRGKACGLEQHWMRLLLRAFFPQTLNLRAEHIKAPCRTPGPMFTRHSENPGRDCMLELSARRLLRMQSNFHPSWGSPESPSRLRNKTGLKSGKTTEWENRGRLRAALPTIHCGDPGPDQQAATSYKNS